MTNTPTQRLSVSRSVLMNVAGQVAPTLIALVAIPKLVAGLGTERFGVLALAWVVVGYAGLFDLGMGRALTRFLAVGNGTSEAEQGRLIWSSLGVMAVVGVACATGGWFAAPSMARALGRNHPGLEAEIAASFRVLAASIPLVVSISGVRAVLEARQRFDLINAVSIPAALLNYVSPLAVLPFSHSMPAVVGTLVAVRVLVLGAYAAFCAQSVRAMWQPSFDATLIGPVLRFGGWTSVTGVVGPLILQADRFLLGLVASLAAVGYYATPSEVLARLSILPAAIVQVLFPIFARGVEYDRRRTAQLLDGGSKFLIALLWPILAALTASAPEALALWLGDEFRRNASAITRILAIGTLVNASAWIPFTLIQAGGRPDVTGKLHLAELPLHVALAYTLISLLGPPGAAVASLARSTIDTALVFVFARRLLPEAGPALRRSALLVVAGSASIATCAAPVSLVIRAAIAAVNLALSWALVASLLSPRERQWLRARWAVGRALLCRTRSRGARRPACSSLNGALDKRPLRLAILGSRGIPARYGGFETFAEQLATRLAARAEFEVTVFCPSKETRSPDALGCVRLEYVRERTAGPLTSALWDTRCLLAAAGRFDVIYLLGYGAAAACWIPRLRGSRVWINVDGLEWKRSKWNAAGRAYLRVMEALCTRTASRLIADAQAIAEHFLRTYGLGVRISFVPYGADSLSRSDAPESLLPDWLRPCAYHLVVARLEPENHVREIVEGYRASRSPHPLVVVGDTNAPTRYVQGLLRLASDRVRFVGGVYDRAKLAALRLHARTYLHGHSVGGTNPSLLEAIGAGNVVLAHDNPFNREVLRDLAHYFREPADVAAMLEVLDGVSDEVRAAIASRCRAWLAERYNWEAVVDRYTELARQDASAGQR